MLKNENTTKLIIPPNDFLSFHGSVSIGHNLPPLTKNNCYCSYIFVNIEK